jgi:hypothetical protein
MGRPPPLDPPPAAVRVVRLKDSAGAPLVGRLLEFAGGELVFVMADALDRAPGSAYAGPDKKVRARRLHGRPRGNEGISFDAGRTLQPRPSRISHPVSGGSSALPFVASYRKER